MTADRAAASSMRNLAVRRGLRNGRQDPIGSKRSRRLVGLAGCGRPSAWCGSPATRENVLGHCIAPDFLLMAAKVGGGSPMLA